MPVSKETNGTAAADLCAQPPSALAASDARNGSGLMLLLLILPLLLCQADEALHELGGLYAQALAELPFLGAVWAHAASFDPLAMMLPMPGQLGTDAGANGMHTPGCDDGSGQTHTQPGLWSGIRRRYKQQKRERAQQKQAIVGPHV